jgi:hypothetical protein
MATGTLTLTLDDFAAAQRLFVRTRKVGPIICLVAFVAMLAFSGFSLKAALAGGSSSDVSAAAFFFAYAGFFGWLLYQQRWGMPFGTRKAFRQQKALQGPITMAWSADGYVMESERGRWVAPWRDYVGWAEDKSTLIALQTDRLFNLVPKRFFSEAELAEMRSYLEASGIKRRA